VKGKELEVLGVVKTEGRDKNRMLASATRELIQSIVQEEELFYIKHIFRAKLILSGLALDIFKQVAATIALSESHRKSLQNIEATKPSRSKSLSNCSSGNLWNSP
jgi:hypothetical protein